MLGFHIDLDLRMIRSQVTLSTGFRFSGLHNRETVASMATGAASQTTVKINPSHTNIGPGLGIQAAIFGLLENRPVAVETACGPLEITVHPQFEPGIDLPDDLVGVGMLAPSILLGLIRMTARTILGRDH